MTIKVDHTLDTKNTYLQGYIHASYSKLVEVLGEPSEGSYKTDAEWTVNVNGKTLTIYNYKDGRNYLGEDGKPVEFITEWHIGGKGDVKQELIALAKHVHGQVEV